MGRPSKERLRSPPANTDLSDTVKVLFASGSEDLIPTAIEHMRQLFPELPLVVVSEFPAQGAVWIPFPVSRGFWDNFSLIRWHFRNQRIRISAVILQPRMPYWRMRFIGFLPVALEFSGIQRKFRTLHAAAGIGGNYSPSSLLANAKLRGLAWLAGRRRLHVPVAAPASGSIPAAAAGAIRKNRRSGRRLAQGGSQGALACPRSPPRRGRAGFPL